MSRIVRPLSLLLAFTAGPLLAQAPRSTTEKPAAATSAGKPTLTEADYSKFESVGASALSPDGKWLAYSVGRGGGRGGRGGGGGGGELHYRNIASDVDKTIAGGSNPVFSSNNRWMFYTKTPEAAGGAGGGGGGAAGRGGRGGGAGGAGGRGGGGGTGGAAGGGAAAAPARASVAILDLSTGNSTILHDIESYVVSSDASHAALRHYPAAGRQGRGADLVIRDIAAGTDVTLGNVADFAWSDDASTLAMIIDVDGKTGNGVQTFSIANNTIKSLDAGDTQYTNLRWRPKSDQLVVFRARIDTAFADTAQTVIAWKGATTAQPTKMTYDFAMDAGFPKDMRVVGFRAPQWSKDGSTLFFGVAPRELKMPAPAGRGTGPNPARVEIWHWKDLRNWHSQESASGQERTRNQLVAWHVGDNKIVRLGDDKIPNITLSDDQKVGLASDEEAYFMEAISSGRNRRDVYTVDVATGKRTKVLTRAEMMPSLSPSGRYMVYTQGTDKTANWFVMDLTTHAVTNLTGASKNNFANVEDDHPVSTRRGYGVGGWFDGEKSLMLYDRFDLWQVNIDGTNLTRLTKGKEDSTVYRPDWTGYEELTINPSKTILLTANGEFNKKSGIAHLTIGQPVHRALWLDKAIGNYTKAKNAEVFTYTAQTAEQSPQLYLSVGELNEGKQVTHANDWLKEYAWGTQKLMDYTNKRGDKLQMMLTYPADYTPGKKYPMVVYYYEKLSQGFHNFTVPTASGTYNITTFSQNGYFVLRPDIKFQPRDPGYSGLDCVTAAVKTAEAAVPDIDVKHVGNFGHSWGGYQSAFYAVHNPGIFAASIAGAPLTDLISMYGYTNPGGGAETGHFETGQERMQVSLWEDPAAYIRNSTVFQTDSLKIPLLLEEGDADNNVNYYQSMELYNFGRRLGKQVVFLVYQGELHSPAGDAAADYHKRQLEWFGYWLKGDPPADWILNGESYTARKKLLDAAFPPAVDANAGGGAAGGRGGGGRGAGGRGGRGGGRGGN